MLCVLGDLHLVMRSFHHSQGNTDCPHYGAIYVRPRFSGILCFTGYRKRSYRLYPILRRGKPLDICVGWFDAPARRHSSGKWDY
jgi:hypothetical protein